MGSQKNTVRKTKVFEDHVAKNIFMRGIKFLAIALPLLFLAPILITIGFKALSKNGSYAVLILGCLLGLLTIGLVIQAFRLILKSLFRQ